MTWQNVLELLKSWTVAQPCEDGLEWPTRHALKRALDHAREAAVSPVHIPEPNRVCQDGNGGIVFEFGDRVNFITIQFQEDGNKEKIHFFDCKPVKRERI